MKQRIPVWRKGQKLYPVSDEGFAKAFPEIALEGSDCPDCGAPYGERHKPECPEAAAQEECSV